jgi:hypothetical protein
MKSAKAQKSFEKHKNILAKIGKTNYYHFRKQSIHNQSD